MSRPTNEESLQQDVAEQAAGEREQLLDGELVRPARFSSTPRDLDLDEETGIATI